MDKEYHKLYYYITPPECDTREKCWEDLGAFLQTQVGIGWAWIRAIEVVSEEDFDTKTTKHRGFVRGVTIPQDWNTLHIPSIGEADGRLS
jgi:hypothetical protein